MRLSLRQLQIFLAVYDHGSTSAAAESIALSQSATSAALNELENVLAVRLFDRIGKRLIINDCGRQLIVLARQMLDGAANIERQFAAPHTHAAGLQIGCSTTIGIYLLPHILATCGDMRPKVLIANTSAIGTAVANFQVDLGLIEGACHEDDLVVEPWLHDELIVTCAPTHALALTKSDTIGIDALRTARWLLREAGSGTREAVEQALLPHLHALQPAGEFSNSEAIKHACAAGLGLACLSRLVVEDGIERGTLVALPTTLPPLRRRFYLITRRGKLLSAPLQDLLQRCRAWQPDAG